MPGYILFPRQLFVGDQDPDPVKDLERIKGRPCQMCGRTGREHRLEEIKVCIEKRREQMLRNRGDAGGETPPASS